MTGRSSTRSARYAARWWISTGTASSSARGLSRHRGVSVSISCTLTSRAGSWSSTCLSSRSALLPYVVPGIAGTGGLSRLSVAVPVREADATVWLPQTEIQRLLAAGWTATGGPSEEYLSDLIQQAVTATRRDQPPPGPSFQVGEGAEPEWTRPFRQAWEDLARAGIAVGEPVSGVYAVEPGVVQHFDPGRSSSGWVICALPRQRPVAVAEEVWQALQAAGAGFPGGEPLAAVGFPVPDPR